MMIKILVPIAAIVVAATPVAAQGFSFTVPTPGYNQGYNQGYEPEYNRGYEPEYNRGYEPEYASPRRQWYHVNRGHHYAYGHYKHHHYYNQY
jgi:hypothetical protein